MNLLAALLTWSLVLMSILAVTAGTTSLSSPPPFYTYTEVKKDVPIVAGRVQRSTSVKSGSPSLNRRQGAFSSYASAPIPMTYTPAEAPAPVPPSSYGPPQNYYNPAQGQSVSYAVPNHEYHSRPVTYNLPSLTFYPPKIIVSKTGVTYYTEPIQSFSPPSYSHNGQGGQQGQHGQVPMIMTSGSSPVPSYAQPPQFHHGMEGTPVPILQYQPIISKRATSSKSSPCARAGKDC